MRILMAAICGSLLLISQTALAVEDGNASQTDMTIAAGDSALRADAELNSVYGQLRTRLKGDATKIKLLTVSQRAWLAFRKADCAFGASGVEGGSAQPMIASLCFEALTTARIKDLRYYLTCQEGDLSCPSWR